MARKNQSGKHGGKSRQGAAETSQAVRESAQKIWLAGLGAFERAKSEGPRMFETLVEQGRNMGSRAVGAADEALKNLRESNYAGGKWDKLEQVFEERVSRSLDRLGVLTKGEVGDLTRQVQELNESVRNLMAGAGKSSGKSSGGKRKASAARKGTTKKAARKPRRKAASRA
ncbi:MAG TPA: phasin family protein [Usitatibacter sp.]|nr:phasin family protein [Usitatibacter sp.]